MPAGQILLLGCLSLGLLSADEHPNAISHPADTYFPCDSPWPSSLSERCSHTRARTCALRSSLTAALGTLPAQRVGGTDLRRGAGSHRRKASNSSKRTFARCWSRSATSATRERQENQRRPAARHGRAHAGRRRVGSGGRAQQAGRELARLGAALPIERNAAERQAARRRDQRFREMDRARRARSAVGSHADGREEPEGNAKADPRDHWAFKRPQRTAPPNVTHAAAARNDIDRFILARLEASKAFAVAPSSAASIVSPRCTTTSSACRRRPRNSTRSPPTPATPSTKRPSIACSPRRASASAGPGTGSTSPATPTPKVTSSRKTAITSKRTRIAIGSSPASTPIGRSTSSSSPKLRPTSSMTRRVHPAMGFLTLGRRFLNVQTDIINDRIDVVSRGLMGLTVACARCHDHKFDPISAADYYAHVRRVRQRNRKAARRRTAATRRQRQAVRSGRLSARQSRQPRPQSRAAISSSACRPINKPAAFKHGSGRREMAEAIASRDNPLTARVWVNRVWGHLFGSGIVDTPSDFGVRGTPPTHPELLDSLGLRVHGRRLVDQATHPPHRAVRTPIARRASRAPSASRPIRKTRCCGAPIAAGSIWRRCATRCLPSAGRLDETMGGPSVELTDGAVLHSPIRVRIHRAPELAGVFPHVRFRQPEHAHARAAQTTAPQQALFLMNSPFAIEQATFLAARSERQLDWQG